MGDSSAMISSNGTDAKASLTCPNDNYLTLAGFPAGVRFNPSDQEIIEHLESMVLVKEGEGSGAHPLINHFIPSIEGDKDICYTHPENLPGVTKDGHSKHFFHRTSKAFPTGKRKRRKIMSSKRGQRSSTDVEKTYWHKTGNTYPVIVGGKQKGCKKILVLQNVKPGKKPEKTNWVMHQYHLGMSEEKDGEEVVSKVFYRCPTAKMTEQNHEKEEVALEATPNILPVSGAAANTAATTDTMVQQPPAKMFQEAGVGDLVSGDHGQVHGNSHHISSQHHVQSVHTEPDNSISVEVGVGDLVSGDQGQVHGNNHHIPSQCHVQSVDSEPDTALSLSLGTGW